MQSDGEASAPNDGFDHQALIYGSDREFLDVALPFVLEGLGLNEPTLVAVQDRHVENLRSALGSSPEGVTLYPVEDWYETSARTREKFARWAGERYGRGNRVRLIGEPPWAIGHEAQIRDWARYESVINIAFAGRPVSFVCPYDAQALPEDILGHARGTHPEIVDGAGITESASFENPHDFCRRLDAAVDLQRGEPALELELGLEELPAIRRMVGSLVLDAGFSGTRTEELVLAVNEITTNAVIHGRPPATVTAWDADAEVVIEVTDAGNGIRDVLAGQLAPPAASLGGRGLWLSRQLCDAVEVREGNGEGCTVVMHAVVPSGDRTLTAV